MIGVFVNVWVKVEVSVGVICVCENVGVRVEVFVGVTVIVAVIGVFENVGVTVNDCVGVATVIVDVGVAGAFVSTHTQYSLQSEMSRIPTQRLSQLMLTTGTFRTQFEHGGRAGTGVLSSVISTHASCPTHSSLHSLSEGVSLYRTMVMALQDSLLWHLIVKLCLRGHLTVALRQACTLSHHSTESPPASL